MKSGAYRRNAMHSLINRRAFVVGAGAATALATGAGAQELTMPSSPVALNIMDIAGNLALSQPAIDAYRARNPNRVSRFGITRAPAPELAGKLRAQQQAGRVDIDIVLTGTDGLFAGIEQQLWHELYPQYARQL